MTTLKTIARIAAAWLMLSFYLWHQVGGPIGAYNAMVAFMWLNIALTPLAMIFYGRGFFQDHRDDVAQNLKEPDQIPEKAKPFLFDLPDFILFVCAAWLGDAWIAGGAIFLMLFGMTIRSMKEDRRKDLEKMQ